jgi:peptidoglycan/LPS O-acetylase OafA/YrhL
MTDFLAGAVVALCGVASLYFWRFHRQTGERFFGLFALAFATLAVSYGFQAAGDHTSEFRPQVFLIRLAAFGLIIAAIVENNRRPPAPRQDVGRSGHRHDQDSPRE